MTKKKPYLVFSYRMMQYLAEKGFKFFATTKNTKFPERDVYIYDNTEELVKAIKEFKR